MQHGTIWGYTKVCALIAAVLTTSYVVFADDAPASGAMDAPPGVIQFVAHNITTAKGTFERWSVTKVQFDPGNLKDSVIEIEVDVASVSTGIRMRDKDLRKSDFFDVAKYPKAHVKVHDIRATDRRANDHPVYTAKLDMDIRGVNKTLTTDFELVSMSPPEVSGSFVMNRRDWNIGGKYRRFNPLSVREKVTVSFSATLPKDLALSDK